MPRSIRCILPQLPHHALQRGNNRQVVFPESADKDFFLKQLAKYGQEESVGIGAYCIMSNHFHLLLYPESREGLIKLLKSVSQIYAQYFNRKYKRTGKIWENRYKLNIVETECEWVIARYIEKNPVRAGLVLDATKYPHSSASANLSGRKDKILTKDIIKKRSEGYVDFFNEGQSSEDDQLCLIRTVIQQQRGFGGKDFIEDLKKRFKVEFEVRQRGRPFKKRGK
jgi:putative transposase